MSFMFLSIQWKSNVTDLDAQHEGLKGSFLIVFLLQDNEMATCTVC